MYPLVLAFLTGFIHDEEACRTQLQQTQSDITIIDGVLIFSLADLYALLIDASIYSYADFRAMLYSSTLNTQLMDLGYQVQVYNGTGKVDSSYYQLVKLR